MRHFFTLLVLIILAAAGRVVAQSSLSSAPLDGGTYTIGGANAHFPTFGAAVEKLNTDGVAGRVFFDVRPGTYNEQLTIWNIPGTSSENTVTFRSENSDSSTTILTYSSTIDSLSFTLRLFRTAHIAFERLTITSPEVPSARTVLMIDVHDVTLLNNVIIADELTFGARHAIFVNRPDSNIVIRGNVVAQATSGITIFSRNNTNPRGIVISENHISVLEEEGISIRATTGAIIERNVIDTRTDEAFSGISVGEDRGALRIVGNTITSVSPGGSSISALAGSQRGAAALIANNFIVSEVRQQVVGFHVAVFIQSQGALDVVHNSVELRNINGTPPAPPNALRIYNPSSGALNVLNNIFRTNNGPAINIIAPGGQMGSFHSDHNDIHGTTDSLFVLNDTTRFTLAGWRARTGYDRHSISVDPGFAGEFDLHIMNNALKGAGRQIHTVPTDIDGERRNPIRPDIGADEMAPYTGTAVAHTPLPDGVVMWRIAPRSVAAATSRYWMAGDTTLAAIRYRKIYMTADIARPDTSITAYVGGIRENAAGQIYVTRKGWRAGTERLLYDFGAGAGDTIYVSSATDTSTTMVIVTATDSVLVDGEYRRRIHTGAKELEKWIAGIGSVETMFYPAPSQLPELQVPELICFKVDGRIIYGTDCEDSPISVEEAIVESGADRPRMIGRGATIEVHVVGDQVSTITLYDLTGRLAATASGRGTIVLSSPGHGSYLYRITQGDGRAYDGKIVIR